MQPWNTLLHLRRISNTSTCWVTLGSPTEEWPRLVQVAWNWKHYILKEQTLYVLLFSGIERLFRLTFSEQDMQALSTLVSSSPFPALTSLSLTLPTSSSPITFFDGVYSIFRTSPLTEFTIWRAGGDVSNLKSSIIPIDFIRSFLLVHGERLQKFAVQRLETTMEVIEEVTKRCPKLEKFFMVLGPCNMVGKITSRGVHH